MNYFRGKFVETLINNFTPPVPSSDNDWRDNNHAIPIYKLLEGLASLFNKHRLRNHSVQEHAANIVRKRAINNLAGVL